MLKVTAIALGATALFASAAFAQPYQSYPPYQNNYQTNAMPCDSVHDSWHDGMHCNVGPHNPAENSRSAQGSRAPNAYGSHGYNGRQ
jgi:hypothetical protein